MYILILFKCFYLIFYSSTVIFGILFSDFFKKGEYRKKDMSFLISNLIFVIKNLNKISILGDILGQNKKWGELEVVLSILPIIQ